MIILLAVAALHGTAWAVMTAPWNGPDEIAHFAYAEHLAGTRGTRRSATRVRSSRPRSTSALYALNLAPILLQSGGGPPPAHYHARDACWASSRTSRARTAPGPNSASQLPALLLRVRGRRVPPVALAIGARAPVRDAPGHRAPLRRRQWGSRGPSRAEFLAVGWARR